MTQPLRAEPGAVEPPGLGESVLSLLLMSDVQVMDSISPARCEWVELLADQPKWQALLHMHRPYEALTHWALAAHVERARRDPVGPVSGRPHDLALFLGDNIDNAQHNEMQAFVDIVAGGTAQLSAFGGVHDVPSDWGNRPWPFWSPRADVADRWKPQGYPAVADFLERASAPVLSQGLGFPWTALPGNHDLMRQGTALPEPAIEAIATGGDKLLLRPDGFDPVDPLALFVDTPAAFSRGGQRRIAASGTRRALDKRAWLAAVVQRGAAGFDASHVRSGQTDAAIDIGDARILMLDTNHPLGDYQGSIGKAQLEWLDAQLAEVGRERGRFAVLASHHGSVSLTNTRGDDPQREHADALFAVAHRHPCVVAWLVGHRHLHQIAPRPGPNGGFWEISTGSLIDWPVQARTLEFLRHPNGQFELACTLQDHGASAGSLAHLHHALARRFAGVHGTTMQGRPQDGTVRLLRPNMHLPY